MEQETQEIIQMPIEKKSLEDKDYETWKTYFTQTEIGAKAIPTYLNDLDVIKDFFYGYFNNIDSLDEMQRIYEYYKARQTSDLEKDLVAVIEGMFKIEEGKIISFIDTTRMWQIGFFFYKFTLQVCDKFFVDDNEGNRIETLRKAIGNPSDEEILGKVPNEQEVKETEGEE